MPRTPRTQPPPDADGRLPRHAEAEPELTLAEQAYRSLRDDIVSGMLAPGEPLRLESLRQRYGSSFSPIREALNRLHSEKLVVLQALRGFRVAPLSIPEMWDAVEARVLIDGEALRRSVQRGGDDWEARVVASFHGLTHAARKLAGRTPSPAERDHLEQQHLDFHRALIDACGSAWLLDFSMQLYLQTERYRRPNLPGISHWGTMRDVASEHRAITDAVVARDAERAVALLAEHYRETARSIEQRLAANEAPGEPGPEAALAVPSTASTE